MKKIILILVMAFVSTFIKANPIYIPPFYLHQFYFDNNGNWVIQVVNEFADVDSIRISSSSGNSIMNKKCLECGYDYIISNDSLKSSVTINPEGDSITIIPYFSSKVYNSKDYTEIVVFGNYKNSILPKPRVSQSIVRFAVTCYQCTGYYSICDSVDGIDKKMTGTLHGYVYDKNNEIINSGSFSINPYAILLTCFDCFGGYGPHGFDIQTDSTYSTSLYSVIYNINSIGICKKDIRPGGNVYEELKRIQIEPMHFTMEPDSSIEMDIHLLEDYDDVKTVSNKTEPILKVQPNPITGSLNFEYNISIPVKSTQCHLDLLNLAGQKICSFSIHDNNGVIQMPAFIENGTYLLQLLVNSKPYSSSKIIVSK
jgi:hypothetical protein